MRMIQRWLDLIVNFLMALGGAALILMMLQVMAEVFLRTFFRTTIPGTEETVSAYYMISCSFLPLAWVQRQRAHVKVELFTLWMSPRQAAGLEGLVYLVCAGATAAFAYATTGKAIAMTQAGEMLIGMIDVVVWPSRWILPVGLGAMTLYMILHGLGDLTWAIKGGVRMNPPVEHELDQHE